jgi:hypothetical protein
MAGTITYLAPIENASGKIFGKKSRFTAVTRTYGKRRRGCSATGQRDLKNHPYTETELARRAKFGAVSKATHLRMKDPEKQAADSAAFRAQNQYDSLYSFIWHLVWEEYEA